MNKNSNADVLLLTNKINRLKEEIECQKNEIESKQSAVGVTLAFLGDLDNVPSVLIGAKRWSIYDIIELLKNS
jgi:hypothetical protein